MKECRADKARSSHVVHSDQTSGTWPLGKKPDLRSRFRCKDQHTPTQQGGRGREVARGRVEGWALWGQLRLQGRVQQCGPRAAGFQCTSPGSSFNKDSSPRHVASPQTSSCVVIRGCFPPIAAPGYLFMPVVWHGPKVLMYLSYHTAKPFKISLWRRNFICHQVPPVLLLPVLDRDFVNNQVKVSPKASCRHI